MKASEVLQGARDRIWTGATRGCLMALPVYDAEAYWAALPYIDAAVEDVLGMESPLSDYSAYAKVEAYDIAISLALSDEAVGL